MNQRVVASVHAAIFLLTLAPAAGAVDGVAVSCIYSGSNANLYGGWGKIHRYKIQASKVIEDKVIFDGTARFATINQQGTRVAFIQQSGQISMVPVDGGTVTDLVKVGSGKGYLDWPDGDWLYYSEGGYGEAGSKVMKKVNVTSKATSGVITFNTQMWLWGVARDGVHASVRPCDGEDGGGTGHVYRYLLSGSTTIKQGNSDDLGMGCGNAIAPGGGSLMRFDNYSHNSIQFHKWDRSNDQRWTISDMNGWGTNMGSGWNRNRWSCNSDNWICTMQGWDGRGAGAGSNMVLYDWKNKEQVVVTSNANGSQIQAEAGDFWVGSVASSKVATPSIAPNGGSFTNTVQVTLTCATSGAAIWYTTNGATPTSSSTSYAGPFTLNLAQSSPVTVKAIATRSGMDNSDVAGATFTRQEAPRLTVVVVSPASATTQTGGSVQFAAKAQDQTGSDMSPQPAITWSISGGQTISTGGKFTAGATVGGPYTVTATAGVGGITKSGTATVTVQNAWVEDFADGNADGWTVGEGTWAVSGQAYANTASGSRGSYSSWAGSADWTDITYTVDVTPQSSSMDMWVIFRVKDAMNYYVYQLSGADLYKQRNGTFTKIRDGAGPTYATDQTYQVSVVLQGSSIKVYSDGQLVIDHTDNTFSSGYVGAGGYNSTIRIDNLVVSGGAPVTGNPIVLDAPNGGEMFSVGDTIRVRWTATAKIEKVTIDLSVDGGKNYTSIGKDALIERLDADWGNYAWVVRETILDEGSGQNISVVSGQCRIKVWDPYGDLDEDVSDANFTIASSATALPRGGVRLAGGLEIDYLPGAGSIVVSTADGATGRIAGALYDLGGRQVAALRSTGRAAATLNVGRLPGGTYLLRVVAGTVSYDRQITVAR